MSQDMRAYFEDGCICLPSGRIQKQNGGSDDDAIAYYMANCKCSRHPESKGEAPWEQAEIKRILE